MPPWVEIVQDIIVEIIKQGLVIFLTTTESTNDDVTTSETKVLTLTEEEFNEYKTGGYFRGIKYRWTSQGGTYTVYISKSSYDRLRQNMESGPAG